MILREKAAWQNPKPANGVGISSTWLGGYIQSHNPLVARKGYRGHLAVGLGFISVRGLVFSTLN